MNIPAYPVSLVIPLQVENYLPYVLAQIDSAKTRIWASIFIVDARTHKDEYDSVRTLIEKLSYAQWRNVDVRVVIGTAKIVDIYVACLASAYYMKKQGIPVKQYATTGKRKSTHSKYMLFDNDLVVIGSNNWTHESFHQAVNSSLAVESDGLNASLANEFDAIWQTSEEVIYGN